ncbi:MAG: hypothetical protein J5I47_04075 [Vicingus serpentipes]|nr:hypothetical protein [Vicingus serpentipes]
MKTFINFIVLLIVTAISFSSCKKNEKEGCTDPTANNYSVLAEKDDGTCEYTDSTFTIWNNGSAGFWGNELTGSFEVRSCFTDTTTIFLNPDSTFIAADTTYIAADTTVTPPILADTIITPADTIIKGDTYLLVNSDTLGNYELIIRLLNKRNAADFVNGYLIFDAKMHPNAVLNNFGSFGVFIHGKHLNNGGKNCSTFLQSDPINIFTNTLDTTSFTEIAIPLADFTNRHMQNIDLVFGVKGTNATPNTPLVIINNIRWVSQKVEE